MVGATLISGGRVSPSLEGLGFPQDKSYYVVVLSFLLVHYFYDHFLFRDFAPLESSRASHRACRCVSPDPRSSRGTTYFASSA